MRKMAAMVGATLIGAIVLYGTLVPIGYRVMGTTADCGSPIAAIAYEPDLEGSFTGQTIIDESSGTHYETCKTLAGRRLFLAGVAAGFVLVVTVLTLVLLPSSGAAAQPAILPPQGPPPVPGAQWDGHRWWWWDGTTWRS